VRDFATATGQLAKTADVEADVGALFADRVRPTPRALPDAVVQQLAALLTRRRQLLDMLTVAQHRLEHAVGPIRRSLVDHLRGSSDGPRRSIAQTSDRQTSARLSRSLVVGRRLLRGEGFRAE
jgi:transposase